MAKVFKTGGVPFCWHCNRQLMRKKGGFYFALVSDPDGHEHRVHKDCLRLVLGDGIREVGGNYATRKGPKSGTAIEGHNG
jgi:hypothetical protein